LKRFCGRERKCRFVDIYEDAVNLENPTEGCPPFKKTAFRHKNGLAIDYFWFFISISFEETRQLF
jgi:hypothetical protein